MSTTTPNVRNGVDVDQLVETIGHIEQQPDLARFQFRARTEWVEGGHARTTIKDFFGAGQEDESRDSPFVLEGDEPPVLLGSNQAPNAVEALLHALGSCLVVGFVYNAAAKGIAVHSFDMELEGDLDLHGFLGLSDEVRAGYEAIRVRYRVETDASREEVEELCSYVQQTSPLIDIIRNPVPVSVELVD